MAVYDYHRVIDIMHSELSAVNLQTVGNHPLYSFVDGVKESALMFITSRMQQPCVNH